MSTISDSLPDVDICAHIHTQEEEEDDLFIVHTTAKPYLRLIDDVGSEFSLPFSDSLLSKAKYAYLDPDERTVFSSTHDAAILRSRQRLGLPIEDHLAAYTIEDFFPFSGKVSPTPLSSSVTEEISTLLSRTARAEKARRPSVFAGRAEDSDSDEEEDDTMESYWKMLEAHATFDARSEDSFLSFDPDAPFRLDMEPIRWQVLEKSREKCTEWLEKYHTASAELVDY